MLEYSISLKRREGEKVCKDHKHNLTMMVVAFVTSLFSRSLEKDLSDIHVISGSCILRNGKNNDDTTEDISSLWSNVPNMIRPAFVVAGTSPTNMFFGMPAAASRKGYNIYSHCLGAVIRKKVNLRSDFSWGCSPISRRILLFHFYTVSYAHWHFWPISPFHDLHIAPT